MEFWVEFAKEEYRFTNIFKQFESKTGQILQSLRKFGEKIKRGSKCKIKGSKQEMKS